MMPRPGIDHDSPIPYYVQVIDVLKDGISRGEWRVGDQLPGEQVLCEMFDVSRTVIRQALQSLTQEGLIVRRKGRGTYVAEPKISENLAQRLTGFYEDMVSQGYVPVSQVLKQRAIPASAKVASYLEIPPGTEVLEIERLRFVQDEPLVLVTTYLPYNLCPDLLHLDLTHQSLYAILHDQCNLTIVRGRRILQAVQSNEHEASLLKVKKSFPLIMLDSVSYLKTGTPIEYYHALHRSDRLRFEVDLFHALKQGDAEN
ncbi:MAG: GntR family transcriptional regulator [Anaerolineae bacterium]|nr:GntR family transcriptional regulator [Anaerolineae bacterium]